MRTTLSAQLSLQIEFHLGACLIFGICMTREFLIMFQASMVLYLYYFMYYLLLLYSIDYLGYLHLHPCRSLFSQEEPGSILVPLQSCKRPVYLLQSFL